MLFLIIVNIIFTSLHGFVNQLWKLKFELLYITLLLQVQCNTVYATFERLQKLSAFNAVNSRLNWEISVMMFIPTVYILHLCMPNSVCYRSSNEGFCTLHHHYMSYEILSRPRLANSKTFCVQRSE